MVEEKACTELGFIKRRCLRPVPALLTGCSLRFGPPAGAGLHRPLVPRFLAGADRLVLAVWMVVCNIRAHLLAPAAGHPQLAALLRVSFWTARCTARRACSLSSSRWLGLAAVALGHRLWRHVAPRRLGAAGLRVPVLLTLAAWPLLGASSRGCAAFT